MERYETNPAPELELGAAEAVLAQAPGLRDHVVGVCDFVERVTPAIREELAPEICSAPEPEPLPCSASARSIARRRLSRQPDFAASS